MSGSFTDTTFKLEEGNFLYYYETGELQSERHNKNGKELNAIHYYKNGKIKSASIVSK